MTGTQRTSDGLDPRRRMVLFRAWHRGTREFELLTGRFADAQIGELSEAEVDDFEKLIEVPERDLIGWITGNLVTPENYDTSVWRKMKAFHKPTGPLHR